MPDLVNRGKHEAAVAGAVLLLFRRWKPSVRIGILPADIFVEDAIETLAPRLSRVHGQAFEQLGRSHKLSVSAQRLSDRWGEKTARQLGKSIARDLERKIRDATRARVDFDEILKDGALGGTRAQNIAITETTRAVSAGELAAADKIDEMLGVKLAPIWVCELNELTPPCKICRPLHRKKRNVWGARFPFGPPAHPRCRCWEEWA